MLTGVEAVAAISAAKNLRDMVASLKETSEKRRLSAAVESTLNSIIEMQSKLIEANEALTLANKRATQAEEKCVEAENSKIDRERYAVTEVTPGFFAYSLKPGMEEGDPAHYLCAVCFAKNIKSFLQFENKGHLGDSLRCGSCQFSIRTTTGSYSARSSRR
jgi:hypothetical protein